MSATAGASGAAAGTAAAGISTGVIAAIVAVAVVIVAAIAVGMVVFNPTSSPEVENMQKQLGIDPNAGQYKEPEALVV